MEEDLEEKKFKFIALLQKPAYERTEEDIDMIEDLVEDNKTLTQFKGTRKLRELCQHMFIRMYKERETIIQEGEIGDCFYIIHSGKATVFKNEYSELTKQNKQRRLTDLSAGDSFGELALLQDVPRAATVIAAEPSWMIILSKETYQNIISNLQTYQIEGTADFFMHLPLFHYISKDKLFQIASKCQFRKFPTNTLILRQDDIPTSIFFIKSGRIKVLRKVEFKIPETKVQANDPEFLVQEPTLEDYDQHKVESKLLEIDELTNGDCFADYAAILKEPIKYTVITDIPSEVFIVDIGEFITLGRDFAESFLKYSKMTPIDTDLRRALIEMNKWNNFKTGVTKSVKADQVNKKQTFESQYRKPWQIPMKLKDKSQIKPMKDGVSQGRLISQFATATKDQYDDMVPNYLTTYDYMLASKKQKNTEIMNKQAKKGYLSGYSNK